MTILLKKSIIVTLQINPIYYKVIHVYHCQISLEKPPKIYEYDSMNKTERQNIPKKIIVLIWYQILITIDMHVGNHRFMIYEFMIAMQSPIPRKCKAMIWMSN